MVFNATFNNNSVISWRSVLLVKETGVPGENHWPGISHWQTLSHNVVSRAFQLTTLVVIGTDCTGKSNYHTITTTTAPSYKWLTFLQMTSVLIIPWLVSVTFKMLVRSSFSPSVPIAAVNEGHPVLELYFVSELQCKSI